MATPDGKSRKKKKNIDNTIDKEVSFWTYSRTREHGAILVK